MTHESDNDQAVLDVLDAVFDTLPHHRARLVTAATVVFHELRRSAAAENVSFEDMLAQLVRGLRQSFAAVVAEAHERANAN